MRKLATLPMLLALPAILTASGGPAPGTQPVNLKAVLDRVVQTVENFDAYLRRYEYKSVDEAMFNQFAETIENDLNQKPRIHPTLIATQFRSNGSIAGYGDLNGNGHADQKEPKLFTVEFDPDNNRIILTSAAYGETTGHAMSRSRGFFAGVLISGLMNRQRTAGIQPGHFNKRNVVNAPADQPKVAKAAAGGSNARSRARSGGVRAGK